MMEEKKQSDPGFPDRGDGPFSSSSGVQFQPVLSGDFYMGSPESGSMRRPNQIRIRVVIPEGFYLGKTPVTQQQYYSVTGSNPTVFPDAGMNAPIDSVTWEDAIGYCQVLTDHDRAAGLIPPDWEYRLPAEAHWEYACRAGDLESHYGPPEEIAWLDSNSEGTVHPVGLKQPNAWGFHDMLGNIFEWCHDIYAPVYRSSGSEPPSDQRNSEYKRAARGGSWYNSPLGCSARFREAFMPNHRGRYIGFRMMACPVHLLDFITEVLEPHVASGSLPRSREQELYTAIRNDAEQDVLKLLTKHSELADYHDEIPPPIHWAVIHDRPQIVEFLLDHGADMERRDMDENSTPLGYAVVYARESIVKLLLSRGADVAGQLNTARKGMAGAFEDFGLPRGAYPRIVDLLARSSDE